MTIYQTYDNNIYIKHIKQKLWNIGEIHKNILVAGYYNSLLLIYVRLSGKNKQIYKKLNSKTNKAKLIHLNSLS